MFVPRGVYCCSWASGGDARPSYSLSEMQIQDGARSGKQQPYFMPTSPEIFALR